MSSEVKNFIFDVYSLMESYFNKIELIVQYKKDEMLSFSFINEDGDTNSIFFSIHRIKEENSFELLGKIKDKLDELI